MERRLPVSWLDQKEGIVRYLNGNEIFGWSALMDSKTYTVTARCLENTEVIEIDGRKLLEILDSDHESGYMFMRDLASIIDRRLTSTSEYLMKHIAEIETERAM
ncbi:MAG: cyclic nucleotide-binding domain-containing protein [Dehalococcoidia bacterium]